MDSRSIPSLILLLIFFTHDVHADDARQKKCGNTRRLRPLPGMGWDSLESRQMGAIISFKYNNCHKTDDRVFEIPDYIEATSMKIRETEVDPVTDWFKYAPMVAKTLKLDSIKADKFSKIDGFFTHDYAQIKRHQLKENYATVRITLRNVVYKLMTSFNDELDAQFKERLDKIGDEIKLGNTRGAKYLADIVVKDYGTHLIRSIDVGGIFGRDDYFSINYVEKNAPIVKDNAQFSFFNAIGLNHDQSRISDSNLSSYESLRRGFRMFTVGGVEFKDELKLEEWESGLYDNLVVIDQSGVRLDLALRRMKLNLSNAGQTIDFIQNAVEKYYRVNIHKGCVAVEQPLFDSTVNYDAGEICNHDLEQQYLGGFYQTCALREKYDINFCKNYTFNNGMSGFSTCPIQYIDRAVIHTDIVQPCLASPKLKNCIIDVTTHVCITDIEPSAYSKTHSFGGVYSDLVENMITKSRHCPPGFDPIGMLGNSQMFVCVGDETVEEAEVAAMSFGGLCSEFDKCPESSCPAGYTQHFGTFYNEIEVYYCARMGSNDMTYEASLLRPPYLEIEDEDELKSSTVVTNKPVLLFLEKIGGILADFHLLESADFSGI
uniref:MACPF domain-containing protein n=1 Tax=Strigamia maritima TaxID=126957 RepID=T1J8W7_STRMM